MEIKTNLRRNVHCILGLPFDIISMDDAIKKVEDSIAENSRCFVSTPNLNFLIGCIQDGDFRQSILRSDLSLADGMPIVWIAKLIGVPLKERVAGSNLFEKLGGVTKKQISVYFFGGPPGVAKLASENINKNKKSSLKCVGYESPGFGTLADMSSETSIKQINDSKADFLIVALGAKKGQAWILNNIDKLSVPVVSHLGAVVNFVAGNIKRAPIIFQKTGLEWLWRIKEEPSLWRRYWLDGIELLNIIKNNIVHTYLYNRKLEKYSDTKNSTIDIIKSNSTKVWIRLAGDWTVINKEILVDFFEKQLSLNVDIEIEIANCDYIDSAVFGLLMLVQGNQLITGKRFLIIANDKKIKRIFSLYLADYLLIETN